MIQSTASFIYAKRKGLERSNAARTSAAAEGWTEANLNFRQRRKCKRVPSGVRAVSLRFQTMVLNLLLGADPTVSCHFTVYDDLR